MIVERLPIQSAGSDDPEEAASDQMEPVLAERLRMLQLGETLRLPIVEEDVIIQKRPIVSQELVIDKRLVEEVRRLSGTVRREDARITWLDAGVLEVADEAREMSDIEGKTTTDTTTLAREEEAPPASSLNPERTVAGPRGRRCHANDDRKRPRNGRLSQFPTTTVPEVRDQEIYQP
jgi:uncharacterized protein (TIGR02271 family)